MAHPIESRSPHHRGDFLSEKSRNPVRIMELVDENETKDAKLREFRIRMKDKTEYKMRETQSKNRKVFVPYLRTPAWTTSHNKGYEEAYSLAMASLGVSVYTMTPQQNLLRFGNMKKSAHDYVEIGKRRAEQTDLDPEHIMTGGSSRGAMYSLAMARVARNHGAEADYIDSISPCIPKPIHKLHLGRAASRLVGEPSTLLRIAKNDTTGHTGILIDTVARPPREALQQGKELFALAGGTVGQLTQELPDQSYGFVQQYHTDGLAFPELWPKLLDPYEGIYQNTTAGTHLDCVSPEAMLESIERVQDIRDGYISGAVGSQALRQMVAIGNPHFESVNDSHLSIVPAS